MGTDRVMRTMPFASPEPVLPIFVCFRFPNGAQYAGSFDKLSEFPAEAVANAEVTFLPRPEALRWALAEPQPPQYP